MTYTAFDLHKKLTEDEGYDPQSDEYYSEIDKRIRLEFPNKFGNNTDTGENTTKPGANSSFSEAKHKYWSQKHCETHFITGSNR